MQKENAMEKLVEMRGIGKSFFGVKVLHDVDFDVNAGEVVALCGENGAGKSTLVNILAAIYKQEEGTVTVRGKRVSHSTPLQMQHEGVSIIHQELQLIENMTVAQNLFLTKERTKFGIIDYPQINREAKKLLERLGQKIDPTAKISSLKIAQKQMVEIAKAISFDAKVIIMDEPTAVLTLVESEILFELIESLTARGIGIIYVSHRLSEVKQIADRVVILRDGHLIATKDISDVTEKEIASLMVGRDVDDTVSDDFDGDKNDIVLEAKNISGYILDDVSFSVARGEILGFSGLVGAGRTELMEMMFGLRKFSSGEVLLYGKPITFKRARAAICSGLGFATEDRKGSGLVMDRSISENSDFAFRIKYKGKWLLAPKVVNARAVKMIKNLRIVSRSPKQLVKHLSGGNQQKVVLAKWLHTDPEIFIIDEPTRGIDIGARQEIYNIIRQLGKDGKTIIIVSSDMKEVLSICQRIIVMHEGKITGTLVGNERTEDNIMHYAVNVMKKEA
jgi:ABC-type sugar transport system ATPase subunit